MWAAVDRPEVTYAKPIFDIKDANRESLGDLNEIVSKQGTMAVFSDHLKLLKLADSELRNAQHGEMPYSTCTGMKLLPAGAMSWPEETERREAAAAPLESAAADKLN